jgi:hypothetical protein
MKVILNYLPLPSWSVTLELSITLLEPSFILLETSVTFLENIYSIGITHDKSLFDDCKHVYSTGNCNKLQCSALKTFQASPLCNEPNFLPYQLKDAPLR